MHIHIAKARSHQSMPLDERGDFLVFCLCGCGKSLEQRKNLFPVFESAAGQLIHDKWVAGDLSVYQEIFESGIAGLKMCDPD